MSISVPAVEVENPFVGLRPFESEESLLFFGRSDQVMQLLNRLHDGRFVAVVGSSGSGKSSLIRAGLVSSLKAGFLIESRYNWTIATMKPGESPVYNLAHSLLSINRESVSPEEIHSVYNDILDSGIEIVVELIQKKIDESTNFFLLVDQFEEIFRFILDQPDSEKIDEANDFVKIILQLTTWPTLASYVVITMRSDFIGDCVKFYGLPEALNKSQYLVPKLNRQELRQVIQGPIKLYGQIINDRLTDYLLNNIQQQSDELPLLQHLLMRIWDHELLIDKNGELDLKDYDAVGGFNSALSNHANEAFEELSKPEKEIAKQIFQLLTDVDEGKRKIRRPTRLSEIRDSTGASNAVILKILNHFSVQRRNFIVISELENDDLLIDISHESLIRQWDNLLGWVDEEFTVAEAYKVLLESWLSYDSGNRDVLSDKEITRIESLLFQKNISESWAKRYHKSSYSEALQFLDNCKTANQKAKKKAENQRVAIGIMAICLIIFTSFYIYSEIQNDKLAEKNQQLEQQKIEIQEARDEALVNEREAYYQTEIARQQTILADSAKHEALYEAQKAIQAQKEAELFRERAEQSAKEAIKQARIAQENAMEAELSRDQTNAAYEQLSREQRGIVLSKFLATKAMNQTELQLKYNLAYLAYRFQTEYEAPSSSEVFAALYDAYQIYNNPLIYDAREPLSAKAYLIDNKYIITAGRTMHFISLDESESMNQDVLSNYESKEPDIITALLPLHRSIIFGTHSGVIYELQGFDVLNNLKPAQRILTQEEGMVEMIEPIFNSFLYVTEGSNSLKISNEKQIEATGLSEINAISASEDKRHIYIGGVNGKLLQYDLLTQSQVSREDFKEPIDFLKYSPQLEKVLVANKNGSVFEYFHDESIIRTSFINAQISNIVDIDYTNDVSKIVVLNTSELSIADLSNQNRYSINISKFGQVSDLLVEPNNLYVYILTTQGKVYKIPISNHLMAEHIHENAKRNLTEAEWRKFVGANIPYERTFESLNIEK